MITWAYDPEGQAYISLTDKRHGHVVESVEVGDLIDRPGEDGPKTLFSIVLDFDGEGRLVGIEIPYSAESVLPRDLLAERGYHEEKHRSEP